jgi:NAD(P)-dependent dehydrogenase (short-subunit alcohol dehydrogenase family)/alkylhydroperoxidase family enzyme
MSARIPPGSQREIGPLNTLIARIAQRATGSAEPPRLFTTLSRHRRLYLPWLMFAGRLMPGGRLPRPDTELVILRVAHNTGCEYEWRHHEHMAQAVGFSADDVARVRSGPSAAGWSARQGLLLRAADELHAEHVISDELWSALSEELSDVELIELCMLVGHYEMLAGTINSLRIEPDVVGEPAPHPLAGKRVFITGAARGIGAATARRLHSRGARLVLAGIEPEELSEVARECDALAVRCDVRDRGEVEAAIEAALEHLGGLDIVIANAGVAAQLPVLGGDPAVFERTVEVNLIGAYYTLRAAAPHIAHPGGYALAISSLAAAVHPPLLGAYSASKAGVEALGDAMRIELASSGAHVGVAYFGELETDMTRRGFGTQAAEMVNRGGGPFTRVTPLKVGIDAIERGLIRRSRRVVAPAWVEYVLPIRMIVQRLVERVAGRGLDPALEIARAEEAPLTTPLPERQPVS